MFVCQKVVKPVKRLPLRDAIICCLSWPGKDLTEVEYKNKSDDQGQLKRVSRL